MKRYDFWIFTVVLTDRSGEEKLAWMATDGEGHSYPCASPTEAERVWNLGVRERAIAPSFLRDTKPWGAS